MILVPRAGGSVHPVPQEQLLHRLPCDLRPPSWPSHEDGDCEGGRTWGHQYHCELIIFDPFSHFLITLNKLYSVFANPPPLDFNKGEKDSLL